MQVSRIFWKNRRNRGKFITCWYNTYCNNRTKVSAVYAEQQLLLITIIKYYSVKRCPSAVRCSAARFKTIYDTVGKLIVRSADGRVLL